MQRILVTGNAGAGKSTFAARLGELLHQEVTGLDRIVWQPGWVKTPPEQRRRLEQEIACRESWLVDGVSRLLWNAADTVILLDVSRATALRRALLRSLQNPFGTRPGLPPNCPEYRILPGLLRLIWNYPGQARARLLEDAETWSPEKKLIRLRTGSEVEDYLAGMGQAGT